MSRARAVIAHGHRPAVVARVAGISRQAIYRTPSRRPAKAGPPRMRPGDAGIVEVARANPTDGTRMVAAIASRELGEVVNRKRAQRVMREHQLLQPVRGLDRRRRPGYFRVHRPDELWHMDMTQEAVGCVEQAITTRTVPARVLTLGTDNGSQFTSRDFRRHLSARGVTHRRGGYRDPESQAFIESWFGQFKKRCAWRAEWETLDQARKEISDYIERYHHRPHSGLAYRTPAEVAETWRDMQDLHTEAT